MALNLNGLRITTRTTVDKSHALIEIASTADYDVPVEYLDASGEPSRPVWLARRHAAGVLARIASEARYDLADDELDHPHGCGRGRISGRCGVDESGAPFLQPLTSNWTDYGPPAITLSVPSKRAKEWRARIDGYLAAIAADDAAVPPPSPAPGATRHLSTTPTHTRETKEPR